MKLSDFFKAHPKVAMGFSGGVDSAYLLYAAVKCNVDVHPYFVKTVFQPDFELEDARQLAGELGVELTVLHCDILSMPQVTSNNEKRCYECKKVLFGLLRDRAIQDGYPVILDGTNASDEVSDRPGMRALKELEVLSPLRECGLTKEEIRNRSRKAGLFTWDKPAYACLATRIPFGEPLTGEVLAQVEEGEGKLKELGFQDFRIRVFHGAARIQLQGEQMALAIEKREQILKILNQNFQGVFLDLKERM